MLIFHMDHMDLKTDLPFGDLGWSPGPRSQGHGHGDDSWAGGSFQLQASWCYERPYKKNILEP